MKNPKSKHVVRITVAISNGNLEEPFRAGDIKWLKKSKSFLSKHRKGNPGGYVEYFLRIKPGLYSVLPWVKKYMKKIS